MGNFEDHKIELFMRQCPLSSIFFYLHGSIKTKSSNFLIIEKQSLPVNAIADEHKNTQFICFMKWDCGNSKMRVDQKMVACNFL